MASSKKYSKFIQKKNGMNYDCLVAASTILKFSPLVLALSMPSEHTNTVFFFLNDEFNHLTFAPPSTD